MKIKAKGGTLERVPGGLNNVLVDALMAGNEVEVDSINPKLDGLVEVVSNKKNKKDEKKEAK